MAASIAAVLLLYAMCCASTIVVMASPTSSPGGITADEISVAFDRIAARYRRHAPQYSIAIDYASREAEKKLFESNDLLAASSHLAVEYSGKSASNSKLSVNPLPPSFSHRRGKIVPMIPAGGYPVMLGTTYNALVGIGTPPQPFRLTVDTGSTLTWAVSADCKPESCPQRAGKKAKYNPSASSTAVLVGTAGTHHEAYGDGEADFSLFRDTVTFLPAASNRISISKKADSLVLANITVGGATKTFSGDAQLDHDGLLGLARKKRESPPGDVSPVLNSLSVTPLVISLEFGTERAQMEIGGLDVARFPNISYFKVTTDDGWVLSNVNLAAGLPLQDANMDMLIDSGSSVVIVPQAVLDEIMSRPGLGATTSPRREEPTVYSLPCTAKLGLKFVLPDGRPIELADETVLMKSNDASLSGDCLSMIVGTSNPFLPAVAGIPLLKNFYTALVSGAPTQNAVEQERRGTEWIGISPFRQ